MSCCLVSCCYTLSPTVDVPRKAPQNIQIVLFKILENGSGQLPPCLRTKVVFDLCLNWTEQDAARRITPTIWRKHGKSRQDKKMFVCTNPEAVSPCLQNHFTQTPRVSRLLCVCACVCMCTRTRVRACVCVCVCVLRLHTSPSAPVYMPVCSPVCKPSHQRTTRQVVQTAVEAITHG